MRSRQRGNFSEALADSAFRPGPRQSRLAVHDRLEGPGGPPGVVAQGGGNARCLSQAQDGDGQVAEAGHDLDGLGGVGEGQASGYRGDFEGAPFGAAVAAFGLRIGHRDLAPGQGGKLGVRAGLVARDDQQVVGAVPGQLDGVVALCVQSIGGDDRVLDVSRSSNAGNMGISLVLAPTSTWPSTVP